MYIVYIVLGFFYEKYLQVKNLLEHFVYSNTRIVFIKVNCIMYILLTSQCRICRNRVNSIIWRRPVADPELNFGKGEGGGQTYKKFQNWLNTV